MLAFFLDSWTIRVHHLSKHLVFREKTSCSILSTLIVIFFPDVNSTQKVLHIGFLPKISRKSDPSIYPRYLDFPKIPQTKIPSQELLGC